MSIRSFARQTGLTRHVKVQLGAFLIGLITAATSCAQESRAVTEAVRSDDAGLLTIKYLRLRKEIEKIEQGLAQAKKYPDTLSAMVAGLGNIRNEATQQVDLQEIVNRYIASIETLINRSGDSVPVRLRGASGLAFRTRPSLEDDMNSIEVIRKSADTAEDFLKNYLRDETHRKVFDITKSGNASLETFFQSFSNSIATCISAIQKLNRVSVIPRAEAESGLQDVKRECQAIKADASRTYAELRTAHAELIQRILQEFTAELEFRQKEFRDLTVQFENKNKELILIENEGEKKKAELRTLIDSSALYVIGFALIAWVTVIGVIVFAIIRLRQLALAHRSHYGSLNEDFSYAMFLELITVFVLTVVILILGVSNRIDKEGLAALIGGISGYVLGRMQATRPLGPGPVQSAEAIQPRPPAPAQPPAPIPPSTVGQPLAPV